MSENQDQDYLLSIVQPLLQFPEDVRVDRTLDERGILLTLSVHKEDMGRIIGRDGDTARAVRRLVRQLGMINKAHIAIKISEPA